MKENMEASASIDNEIQANDKEIQKFLREAGIDENTPIDPSSRVALQELLAEANNRGSFGRKPSVRHASIASNEGEDSYSSPPPVAQVETTSAFLQRHVSDLSGTGGFFSPSPQSWHSGVSDGDHAASGGDTNASTAGSVYASLYAVMEKEKEEEKDLPTEQRILHALERQSNMILDLHQRLDHLTTLVQQQPKQQVSANAPWFASNGEPPRNPQELNERINDLTRLLDQYKNCLTGTVIGTDQPAPTTVTPRPNVARNFGIRVNQQQVQPPPIAQPRVQVVAQQRLGPDMFTRLTKLFKVFMALRRRQAPNFDGGLIFKVLIMLTILLSRLTHRRNNNMTKRALQQQENAGGSDTSASVDTDAMDWVWAYRFYFMIVFVMGGFLIQTGFLQFLYTFFVKENYVTRIWLNGEEIPDVEQEAEAAHQRQQQARLQAQEQRNQVPPAAVPQPPNFRRRQEERQQQEQAQQGAMGDQRQAQLPAAVANAGWRNTFLAGAIAPPNANPDDPNALPEAGGGAIPVVFRVVQDVGFFVGSFFLSIFPMWRPQALVGPRLIPPRRDVHDDDDDANDGPGLPEVRPPRDPLEAADDSDDDE